MSDTFESPTPVLDALETAQQRAVLLKVYESYKSELKEKYYRLFSPDQTVFGSATGQGKQILHIRADQITREQSEIRKRAEAFLQTEYNMDRLLKTYHNEAHIRHELSRSDPLKPLYDALVLRNVETPEKTATQLKLHQKKWVAHEENRGKTR
jgi:hypothetical protein